MCNVHYESFEELPQELKDKFKPNKVTKRTKDAYINFINELNKCGDELVGDYVDGSTITLIKFGECGHIPSDGMKPKNYKRGNRCRLCKNKRASKTKIKDLKGQRFGRLTVISLCEEQIGGNAKWNCLCDCGNMTIGVSDSLKSGKKQSCGCLAHDTLVKRNKSKEQRQAVKDAWANDDGTRLQQIQQLGYDSKGENNYMYGRMGELSGNWKGGITPISYYLRKHTKQWDKDVRQTYNKKCALTGIKCTTTNSAVHHLYGFNMIVEQAHTINNIEVKPQVKDYTQEELQLLENYVLEWHKDTSNGILLSNEVHELFHNIYNRGDNTPQQFEQFKTRYLNHEFDNELN